MPHDRSNERAHLKAQLIAGRNLLMLAPRRIGKTWLLHKMRSDMEDDGWLCILIDVEGITSEEAFLQALCADIERAHDLKARLLAHLTQRLKQIKDSAWGSLREAVSAVDPRNFLEVLVAALAKEQQRTLIMIDEIALFVLARARQDPEGTQALLYHLRKLQQKHPEVKWFLTGSIGLDIVARRHGMAGALLDYDIASLDPFSPDEARDYIKTLQASGTTPAFDFGADAFERLVADLGWLSPYYLRHITQLIRPTGEPLGSKNVPIATSEDVGSAIARILQPDRRGYFAAWDEHIRKNFTATEAALLDTMLDILCEAADGETEATILTRLASSGQIVTTRTVKDSLNDLQADGYIRNRDGRWAFQSGLLRQYWLEYKKQ